MNRLAFALRLRRRARARQRRALVLIAICVLAVCIQASERRIFGWIPGTPRFEHTIPNRWLTQLRTNDGPAFKRVFRMDASDFRQLVSLCRPHMRPAARCTIDISMFVAGAVLFLAHGYTWTTLQQILGISASHLQVRCKEALKAIIAGLHDTDARPEFPSTPEAIAEEKAKWSSSARFTEFDGCVTAADGTLVPFACKCCKDWNPAAWRCRKGFTAINLIVCCSFDKKIQYAVVGYEGSAHDSRVVNDSKLTDKLPEGTFGLFDAGMPLTLSQHGRGWLVPYRGVRYHLKEWAASGNQPANEKELFNLRHSSLRSSRVEIVIGFLKGRFKCLRGLCTSIDVAKLAIFACMYLHNYILQRHPNWTLEDALDGDDIEVIGVPGDHTPTAEVGPSQRAKHWRSSIARSMYEKYVEEDVDMDEELVDLQQVNAANAVANHGVDQNFYTGHALQVDDETIVIV